MKLWSFHFCLYLCISVSISYCHALDNITIMTDKIHQKTLKMTCVQVISFLVKRALTQTMKQFVSIVSFTVMAKSTARMRRTNLINAVSNFYESLLMHLQKREAVVLSLKDQIFSLRILNKESRRTRWEDKMRSNLDMPLFFVFLESVSR